MVVKTKNLQDLLTQATLKTQDNPKLLQVDDKTQEGRDVIKAWKNMKSGPLSPAQSGPDNNTKPLLRSDQENHILIYPGAFNPPHKAHLDTLLDGFQNSGPGLNIVAAIAAPTGDNKLRAKEAAQKKVEGGSPNQQVVLDQAQRVALLEGGLRQGELASHTRVWAFPGLDPFAGYLRVVRQLAADEGFAVEFVSLKGPDHLLPGGGIVHPAYPDCRRIIFTEATRRVGVEAWEAGRLRDLRGGWTPWASVGRTARREGVVWRSTLAGAEGCEVRLLTDADAAGRAETSSTDIRSLLVDPERREDPGSLVRELERAGALCVEMLLEFHRENTQRENSHNGSI